MYFNYLIILLTGLIMISGCSADMSDNVIIESFDTPSYDGWIREGRAFGDGPEVGEDLHMVGVLGRGFATSVDYDNEPASGTMTSTPFLIEKESIHFLLGAHEIHFMPGTFVGRENLQIQLLVDDKVVRSTSPDEYHAMFWRGWDVSNFRGQMAQIRIMDNDERPWAHIDVDQIVMNDIPVDGLLAERRLTVTKPKLNFPVNEKYGRYYLELWVEGKQVRGLDVALAPEDIDYWVVTDLSAWQGKEVIIRTRQYAEHNPDILDRISFADRIIDAENIYQEKLRQQFHFSSKRGWLNDPNGLVYYDGEYHLFYQHNPFGWDHSRNDYNKTWGHAVSTDLVHWKELPGAIHPDHLGPIYSGSAIVDFENTSGFQSGEDPPIICIYTSAGGRSPWSINEKFTQSLAYSNDRGRTFTIYEENPVQKNLDYINRDPNAIWHEPTKRWIILLHFDEQAMVFFTSKDLKTWQKQSEFDSHDLVDCPELFELPVDGDTTNKKWVIYGGSGAYHIGNFDGKHFTPETELIKYNLGNAFYASQTFSNAPDNRRIQMAWALIPTPGMPFNMSMLFPVELTLKTTDEGIRVFAYPVKEIANLHSKTHTWNDRILKNEEDILSEVNGGLYDIDAEFQVDDGDVFGFQINGLTLTYNFNKQKLTCGEEEAALEPVNGRIKLRILADRMSVEVFANDGRVYMPLRSEHILTHAGLNSVKNAEKISILNKSGDTNIHYLKVSELKSIWKNISF